MFLWGELPIADARLVKLGKGISLGWVRVVPSQSGRDGAVRASLASGVNVRELLSRPLGQVLTAASGTVLAGLHMFYLPDSGLDSNWHVGLSMAQDSVMRFGPDLIFNYGPLGWLDTGAVTTQSIARWRLGFGVVATFLALLVVDFRTVRRRR